MKKLYKIYDSTEMTNTIEELALKCFNARKAAEKARLEQIAAENELLDLTEIQDHLKDSGTTTFLNGFLKIQNKLNKKWNQKQLSKILEELDLVINPFEIEYKPNAARLKVLQEEYPEDYQRVITALTESPAKPYFTFQGE